ncbi:hypothetical protein F511_23808 [Dorcoceras hygrometricum]|uniref:Thaumatin-like protein 1 n=1 Tax=Dorcoceras hygrometricum TaxID=472368 RepID=A0A2Z7ACG5_9LAMI|nr:hypothetical protein F511_23808 [Dorcoceras hygrometricum]
METTGFELPKGGSRAFQAPTGWSGRFWGRTGCTFDGSGRGSCATGDCGSGEVECNGAGSTAATLAEFTLGLGSMDFYDVSLVDGYNLPVMVDVSGGSGQCESTGCAEDLNRLCPTELRTEVGGACRSACDAYGTPEYCCRAEYGSPATCKPSTYSQVFKAACPKSYSYAYDDATSTFTCTAADYLITFCPNDPSQKSSKSSYGTPDDSGPEHGSGVGPGSGSIPEAMLADGSWHLAPTIPQKGDSTSTVEQLRPSNPVHDRNLNSFAGFLKFCEWNLLVEMVGKYSDGGDGRQRREGGEEEKGKENELKGREFSTLLGVLVVNKTFGAKKMNAPRPPIYRFFMGLNQVNGPGLGRGTGNIRFKSIVVTSS